MKNINPNLHHMINNKPAPTDHPIADLIANRWSPIGYTDKPVEDEKLNVLLEAARWAPSAYNEQPWSYVVGRKGDDIHTKLSECLVEGNSWAKEAPILMLSIAKNFFEHKHKPNRHGMHDTGAASTLMAIQATDLDLVLHQMSGYNSEKAKESFNINEDYESAAMIAIGYPSGAESLPGDMKEREQAPRSRKPFEDMIWKA